MLFVSELNQPLRHYRLYPRGASEESGPDQGGRNSKSWQNQHGIDRSSLPPGCVITEKPCLMSSCSLRPLDVSCRTISVGSAGVNETPGVSDPSRVGPMTAHRRGSGPRGTRTPSAGTATADPPARLDPAASPLSPSTSAQGPGTAGPARPGCLPFFRDGRAASIGSLPAFSVSRLSPMHGLIRSRRLEFYLRIVEPVRQHPVEQLVLGIVRGVDLCHRVGSRQPGEPAGCQGGVDGVRVAGHLQAEVASVASPLR